MRLKARFNEENYSVNFTVIDHRQYFDLYEEYEASMDKIRNNNRLNIKGICYGITRHDDTYIVSIAKEEVLKSDDNTEHEADENAMIIVPLAIDSPEAIEDLKKRFLGEKIRCFKAQNNETGEYNLSLSLIPKTIAESGSGLVTDVVDREDHIDIVFEDDEAYSLRIPNIGKQENAEMVRMLRYMVGSGMILEVDKDKNILSLFGANRLPKEESPEGDIAYARILFMPFEYNEFAVE